MTSRGLVVMGVLSIASVFRTLPGRNTIGLCRIARLLQAVVHGLGGLENEETTPRLV